MDLSKLVEWVKLSPKYMLPISLVCGLLLIASESLLAKFGLKEFVVTFRPWIGVIFLMSASLIVVDVIYRFGAWLKSGILNLNSRRSRLERLKSLTPEEKQILLGFVLRDTRTQSFSINNGVVIGLEVDGIIYRASNVGHLYGRWPFNIQPWAWKILKERYRELFSEKEINNFKFND